MNKIPMALGVLIALATTDSVAGTTHGAGADPYPNYDAARRALERGDCDAGVGYLETYLRNHSYIREKYPDHYRAIRFVMAQCAGGVKVRGIEEESGEIDPLPDHPPMTD